MSATTRDCCDHPAETLPAASPKWMQIALALAIVAMAYMLIEGVVAVWSGIVARSVALVAFGLDSAIEFAAAALVAWRVQVELRGADRKHVERVDHTVRRFVGGTFLALAIYVIGEATHSLWTREAPEGSTVGIVLCLASLVIMPALAWGKLRAAKELRSRALRAEAKESIVCAYMSLATLVGLALNSWRGWWWADSIAALTMVPWLVKEGLEGLRGDDCCDDEQRRPGP